MAVLWTTDRDLRITSSDGGGPEALGWEDPLSPLHAAHREALAGRGASLDLERDGRAWRVALEPLPGGAGVIGIAVDVSDVHRAQRMDALGRLAGGVAHDFNNVLTVIAGYGDLLVTKLNAESPARRHAEEIRKASAKAAEITGQLLAFSRRQVLAPKVFDLHAVLEEMEEEIARHLGAGRRLLLETFPGEAPVRLDPEQLRRALRGLAAHGRDAVPEGGALRVATRREGGWIVLEVADGGPGLGPEALAHLFEPFYATKDRPKGAGLALAMVHGFLRQSGGEAEAESAPGEGTRIRLRLPAAAARGQEVILVVEDEESIRDLVRGALEEKGYVVLVASDGGQAMEVLGGRAQGVDLLLTDVVMPRMGGGELARRYRTRRPGARVLFISGFTDDRLAREGLAAGKEPLLRKPFAPQALVRKVREVLDA